MPPTAFVSYSWDDEEHQSWVTRLAADLTARGVAVTLDRWDRCGLVTGGWPGVDEAVARSFAAEVGRRRLPLEDLLVQVIPEHELPSFPAGDLILVRRGSDEWLSAIARSDVVVLIGGAGGTWTTGRLALQERKVVFPLADTGGDAKRMYMHMLKHWDRLNMASISRRDFQGLGGSAPDVVSQVEVLLRAACVSA